jgi:hypothetical protein
MTIATGDQCHDSSISIEAGTGRAQGKVALTASSGVVDP